MLYIKFFVKTVMYHTGQIKRKLKTRLNEYVKNIRLDSQKKQRYL